MLQTELDECTEVLHEAQDALAQVADRITQPGIALHRGNVGITRDAGIAILEAQVDEVLRELDDLSDLALRNNIPPGFLRGCVYGPISV